MLKWLFGGKKSPETLRTPEKSSGYTPEMDEVLRSAAPLDIELAERLAKELGRSTRSVIARAVRLGVPYQELPQKAQLRDRAPSSNSTRSRSSMSSPKSKASPSKTKVPKREETVTLGAYCTTLRYDEEKHGAALPRVFTRARKQWLLSGNNPDDPRYLTACKLLSKCFLSEFTAVDSASTFSIEVDETGATKRGEKHLEPIAALNSMFDGEPELKSVEVVALDFRVDPSTGPVVSADPLLSSPDVVVLATYDVTLRKGASSERLAEWLTMNESLVAKCFSIELGPDQLEQPCPDDDDGDSFFSCSYSGGEVKVIAATGTKGTRRDQLVTRVRRDRAAELGSPPEDSMIQQMIQVGDSAGLRTEIEQGLDVNCVINGQPVLKLALLAVFTAPQLFEYDANSAILSRHASLDEYRAHLKLIVFLLLDNGANVDIASPDLPITTIAELLEDTEIADAIRSRSNGAGNDTALLIAAEKGDIVRLRQLLESGTNVNTNAVQGTTPLMMASQGPGGEDDPPLTGKERIKHEAVIRLLLERGAEVNAVSFDGNTALGNAVRRGNMSIAKILLDAGAKAENALPGGQNILEIASQKRARKSRPTD